MNTAVTTLKTCRIGTKNNKSRNLTHSLTLRLPIIPMRWFQWLAYYVGWSRPFFSLHSTTLDQNSFLSKNSFCILTISNTDEDSEYFLHLKRYNDSSFFQDIEIEKQIHKKITVGIRELHWKIPEALQSSVYYLECSGKTKLLWKSNPIMIVDFEFKLLDENLIAINPAMEWPYLVGIKYQLLFPFGIAGYSTATNYISSCDESDKELQIAIRVSRNSNWFLNIFNPYKFVASQRAQALNEIALKYLGRYDTFNSTTHFEWEFWLDFGNGFKCCIYKIGPFKPVITIDSIESSAFISRIVRTVRGNNPKYEIG